LAENYNRLEAAISRRQELLDRLEVSSEPFYISVH